MTRVSVARKDVQRWLCSHGWIVVCWHWDKHTGDEPTKILREVSRYLEPASDDGIYTLTPAGLAEAITQGGNAWCLGVL